MIRKMYRDDAAMAFRAIIKTPLGEQEMTDETGGPAFPDHARRTQDGYQSEKEALERFMNGGR